MPSTKKCVICEKRPQRPTREYCRTCYKRIWREKKYEREGAPPRIEFTSYADLTAMLDKQSYEEWMHGQFTE